MNKKVFIVLLLVVFMLAQFSMASAAVGESGRLPGDRMSTGILATDILVTVVGAALAIPAAVRLVRAGHFTGVILAALGMPLVTLLCGGLLVSALAHRIPMWQLLGIGGCGLALVGMSARACRLFLTLRPS